MFLYARFRFQAKRTSNLFRVRSAVAHAKQTPFSRRDMEIYHRVIGLSNATRPGVSISPYFVFAGHTVCFRTFSRNRRCWGQIFRNWVLPPLPLGLITCSDTRISPEIQPPTKGRPRIAAAVRTGFLPKTGQMEREYAKGTGMPRLCRASGPLSILASANRRTTTQECGKQPASCGSECPASRRCRSRCRCRTTCPRGDGCPRPRTGCPRQGCPSALAGRNHSPCP